MKAETRKQKFTRRFWEILPGGLAWIVITSPLWGGIFFPHQIAYFVLIFNAFWVYKSISSTIFFFIGRIKIINGENTDWMSKLKRLKSIERSILELKDDVDLVAKNVFDKDAFKETKFRKLPNFTKKIIFEFEKRKTLKFLRDEIKLLERIDANKILDWEKVRHVVIIPYWKEEYPVLKRTMDRLKAQAFQTKKISIVLGAEARHPPAFELGLRLKKEYGEYFENIWVNNHILSGKDIVGKSSNMASCGHFAKKKIDELDWDKEYLTITSCDCDTQFDKNYFAYLTYLFVLDDKRYRHFFAAPMYYYANIWKVPFYSRVTNTIFTVNNTATAVRVDKFIQVSSYSFSWKLLEEIDFWSVDIIPEDFHMFFKALFLYGDEVTTVPIFLRNLADAAESVSHRGTIKNQYEQVKRWAWGVSDNGWMIRSWFHSRNKSLYTLYRVFHTVFDHFTWSIISFILTFGANIPPLVNKEFSSTIFGQKLPKVSSFMLTLTTVGFVFILIFDFLLKPRREGKSSILRLLLEPFNWIVFPFVAIIFGAIPGLDAQTRLLLGKYMEYRLTEKH